MSRKNYIPFNINSYVKVRLTDYGREMLAREHKKFWENLGHQVPYSPPKEDKDGWSKWQMWDLMQKLGSHISMSRNLFDTNILIERVPSEL